MVCFRYITVNTLHKCDNNDDGYDDDDNNNNNNNNRKGRRITKNGNREEIMWAHLLRTYFESNMSV